MSESDLVSRARTILQDRLPGLHTGSDKAALGRIARAIVEDLTSGPLWRHVKTGGEYREVCTAELQVSTPDIQKLGLLEGDRIIVYEGADGRLWARWDEEFRDGRFVPLDGVTHEVVEDR